MSKIYFYNRTTDRYVLKNENGTILKVVPVGTIINSVNGICRLGPNGKVEYLQREEPNVDRVINNLWAFENPNNEGYDPTTGLYFPVTTSNGNQDVAFGIDLDKNPNLRAEANKGITRERANEIARVRLDKSLTRIEEGLSRYTERPDTISPQIKEGLLDMAWQLGDDGLIPHVVNGEQKGYPKLFRAIAEGDYETIKEESKVSFKNKKGEKQYDKRRHQLRLDNYLNYQMTPYLMSGVGFPDNLLIN